MFQPARKKSQSLVVTVYYKLHFAFLMYKLLLSFNDFAHVGAYGPT